jgi:dolichyl-phosphate-mannose-protein mannosyltransferase
VTLAAYFAGQRTNPPGFYIDEASIAYNALSIARDGHDEWGAHFPLYFRAFGEYKNPAYIYLLAGVFKIVAPSNLVARRFSALLGYLAAAVLGLLAHAITRRKWIGWTIFVAALITPQLFDLSRLVFEVALFPLAVALFLWAAHTASRRERWSAPLIAALVGSLTLLTLAYSTGRLLGALFALSLFILADSRQKRIGAAITLGLYIVVGVIPLVVYNSIHDGALTARMRNISFVYVEREHPLKQIRMLEEQYVLNALPLGMALEGDNYPRHHPRNALGSILLGEFILVAISIAVILTTRRRERWWIFMLVVAALSILPASLTEGRYHTLRMAAYPVALVILCIPALELLIVGWPMALRFVIGAALLLCALQSAWYFHGFAASRAEREIEFDVGYRQAMNDALAQPERPIYLPTYYVSAYWYGALEGISRDQFKDVPRETVLPSHSVALANSDFKCEGCTIVSRHGEFTVWRSN